MVIVCFFFKRKTLPPIPPLYLQMPPIRKSQRSKTNRLTATTTTKWRLRAIQRQRLRRLTTPQTNLPPRRPTPEVVVPVGVLTGTTAIARMRGDSMATIVVGVTRTTTATITTSRRELSSGVTPLSRKK